MRNYKYISAVPLFRTKFTVFPS